MLSFGLESPFNQVNIEDRTCTLSEASIHNEREYYEVDDVETTKALMTTNVDVKRNISLNLSSTRKRGRSPSPDQQGRKKARSEPRERHSPTHWREKTAERSRFEKEKERLVRSANFGEEARKLLEAPLSSSLLGVPLLSSSSLNEGSFVQLQNDAEEIDLTMPNSPKSNSTMWPPWRFTKVSTNLKKPLTVENFDTMEVFCVLGQGRGWSKSLIQTLNHYFGLCQV